MKTYKVNLKTRKYQMHVLKQSIDKNALYQYYTTKSVI